MNQYNITYDYDDTDYDGIDKGVYIYQVRADDMSDAIDQWETHFKVEATFPDCYTPLTIFQIGAMGARVYSIKTSTRYLIEG